MAGEQVSPRRDVPQRSWRSVRWRQFRNAPQPVVRAVVANLAVAAVGASLLLAFDLSRPSVADVPGRDALALGFVLYVVLVLLAGSLFTYLWVPLPTGSSGHRRRSSWSAVLGFFTAVPVAYLALVVAFQVLRPHLG